MIKKTLFLLTIIISSINYGAAHEQKVATYRIPEEKILTERFHKTDFEHFFDKSGIIHLAGQEKTINAIILAVNIALVTYTKHMERNNFIAVIMDIRKEEIFEILLRGFPGALKEVSAALKEIGKSED